MNELKLPLIMIIPVIQSQPVFALIICYLESDNKLFFVFSGFTFETLCLNLEFRRRL